MNLIINNRLIDAPIIEILNKCKKELTNNKLHSIIEKGDWISVTCPFHSDGIEKHNSCGIVCDSKSELEYGSFNCFTCHEKGSLYHFIGACFDKDDEFGKKWLIDNFGNTLVNKQVILPKIEIEKESDTITLNEEVLNSFQSWHPYFAKRKISKEIVEKFKLKYDSNTTSVVFPVWDEFNNLVFLTRRSVNSKLFMIDKNVEKPVYLLNFILKDNIKKVVICESQINALTCWSKGIPAVALFGTGSQHQYDVLNRSGIRNYILAFDGDEAGDKGRERFIKNIRKDVFIDIVDIPRNKDVNDLDDEEFTKCFNKFFNNERKD